MVTKQDFQDALGRLGVVPGDAILTHSSFKSLGPCENGADTVVSAMLDTVGPEGTVIFPTLCQKDWEHVYENWHMDAPSDIGYLTNYFRKLPGALRSNQATHSVAAIGKQAEYLTCTHGETGRRYGIFGDTPFSADSPWQKMYEMDVKVIFLGCSIRSCTFRHLAEYIVIDEYLKKAEKSPDYAALKDEVWDYNRWERRGVWLHIVSLNLEKILEAEGKLKRTTCGDADLLLLSSRDFVDLSLACMREKRLEALSSYHKLDESLDWMRRIEAL